MTEIEKLLKSNEYKYYKKNGVIIVTHQGNVDLDSLTSITTRGETLKLKTIDGYTMVINSLKKKDDFTIYKAQYMGNGEIEKLRKCFVAERGEFFAHGETIQEATSDVNFKFLQENFDLRKLISEIKEKQTVSVEEYRLLTGACKMGVANFMEQNNITEDKLPLEKVLEITSSSYGGNKMQELFN